MSEAAPERTAPPAPRDGGSFLTRKMGPLPTWGWITLGVVGGGAYLWFRNRSANAAAANAAASAPSAAPAAGTDTSANDAVLQTEIQDLQGENSTQGKQIKGLQNAQPKRHVSDGKQTLNQIAKAAGTSIPQLLADARSAPETGANLAKLEEWAKHPARKEKGIVYYTR